MLARLLLVAALLVALPTAGSGQAMDHDGGHHDARDGASSHDHDMLDLTFAGGWSLRGMGQLFPIATLTRANDRSPLEEEQFRVSQPVGMFNITSPGGRLSLRVTPNLEGVTMESGESTLGAWGEGFIDRRHPHTFLHEAMLSLYFGEGDRAFSISGGKGFAPFGTEDPMSRPVLKYPTNHHLSQILERFTLNGIALLGPWSFEAGIFGGSEPEDAWDLSNYDSFGDSWSARVTRRFGEETRPGAWATELSASFGMVNHAHGDDHGDDHLHGGVLRGSDRIGRAGLRIAAADHEHADGDEPGTRLANVAARWDRTTEAGRFYALIEASASWEEERGDGYTSILAELLWNRGRHSPYARLEFATRPEYTRQGGIGEDFFRYDHDADPIGATRWTLATLGYGWTARAGGISVRPFVELQWAAVEPFRGGIEPAGLFSDDRLTALSIGTRIYLGGDPMRMGNYGVLDPMTRMGGRVMGRADR